MSRKPTPDEYAELMGRKPPVDESEDAWQWEYQGTKAEREALLERLGVEEDDPDEQIHQDESLF